MYSVDAYGKMIVDELRTGAYVRALKKVVRPGSVVVELGTGPGFFAFLACKLGARRVFAIEPDNVIQLAIEGARLNGFSDRIEFVQELSTNISLPLRADVIIADLRGVLPFFSTNLPSIKDARTRFLAADGVLIPSVDHLYAALAQHPATYNRLDAPWGNREEISLSAGRSFVMNSWLKSRVEKSDLLCEPVCWHSIDYSNIESFDANSEMTFVVIRNGTVHGIAVWFDSELCADITMSNAPGQPELIYGNAFFPLTQPVDVTAGQEINFRMRVDLIRDEYIWSWETQIKDRKNPGTVRMHYKQSTLFGVPLSQSHLTKRANSYTPVLSEEAVVNSFILSRIDGKTSVEQLAQKVMEEFPQQFANHQAALDAVAKVSAIYSK